MPNKKYDWMALLQYQPNYSLSDFKDLGVTPENASFKSRDYYKNLKEVQESTMFLNDAGEFDNSKFNKFYDSAAILYNNYANEEVFNNLASSKTYDPYEWWNSNPEKVKDTAPRLIVGGENIPMITRSIREFGVDTESPFSIRELGQRRNYFDSETNTWSDKKPNDFAGFFKSWTAPQLVLATYDEDTTEPDEYGRMILHKKGEIKLDKGLPYYRTLRKDEDVSGKDFLLREDIISVDGSKGNKFDIFDADGKRTSGGKVALHTVARVIPYLLPYVGQYYAYLMAAKNIAEFVPQFLKTVDGFVTNDAMSNSFGQTMNHAVGWMKRLDHGVSDYSRENLVTWENAGKMFADITGQLFEQKGVQKITQLFKNPAIKNNARIAKFLSYSYMSTTSAEEAYDIMKQAGANDRTAGLAMWALIGVYYKLMSADYYKHALFRNSMIDERSTKDVATRLGQLYKGVIEKEGSAALSSDTPEAAAKTTNWFMRQWEKLLGVSDKLEDAGILGGKTWLSSSLSEGVEEVMEEVGIDSIKGLTKALEALGVDVGDSELDFGFSAEDVLQRYGMSFAGGAFGGAVFHGYNLLDPQYRESIKNRKIPETVLGELAEIVMQNKQGEIYEQLTKDHKTGVWASPALSSTKFSVVRDVDGDTVVFEGADEGKSQNDMVYNEAYKTVKFFEELLKSQKFQNAVKRVKETTKLNDQQATLLLMGNGVQLDDSAQNLILNDLKTIATNIMSITAKMKEIEDRLKPSDANGGDTALKERLAANGEYQELVEKLDYWRNERDLIYDKKNISKYMGQAALALNNSMMEAFLGFHDVESYAQARFQKPYIQLTDTQKYQAQNEFNSYFDGENHDIFKAFHLYNQLSNLFKTRLLEKDELLKNVTIDPTVTVESVASNVLRKRMRITGLSKAIADTNAKENKTENDIQNIEKWTAELDKLNDEVSKVDLTDDSKLVTRQHTNDFEDATLFDFANALIALYKQTEGKHRYDDADLDRFISRIRNMHGINLLNTALEEYVSNFYFDGDEENGIAPLINDEGEAYKESHGIGEDDDFFWGMTSVDMRSEFMDLIKSYYDNLDDIDVANAKYNEIINFLKNKAKLTDDEITRLLYSELGDYGVSLIPDLGRPLPEIMQQINDSKKKAIYGDAIDLVRDFLTAIKEDSLVSILDVLNQEELRMINTGMKEYTIGNDFYVNQFKELQSILNVLNAVIGGAYDKTNEFLNPYRKNEGLEEYAVISENTGKILQNDIAFLKNKITTLLSIDAVNSGQKLREQREIGANMRKKMLAKIISRVHIEDFKREFGFDPEQLLKDITSADFNINDVNYENYAEKEAEIIKVETAIFDKIKALGLSNEDLIDKLIRIYGDDNLHKMRSTKLTKNPDEQVTAYDAILYAATIMSMSSNDFYVLYNDAIKKAKEIDPEFSIVPVYGQEYALRLGYAYAHNMSLFNTLLDKIAKSGKDVTPYQAARRILYNMVNVFGGASTGKTRGVGAMLRFLFPDAAFRFIAPTDAQVSNLLNTHKEDPKSDKGQTVDEFIKKINPGIDDKSNLVIDKETKIRSIKEDHAQDYDWFGDASMKIMIMDESAMNNSIRLKAISEYAQKNNILVFALGDPNQNTGQITYETGTNSEGRPNYDSSSDGYEECVYIKTPYLVANFRSIYRSKVDNYSALLGTLNRVEDSMFENGIADPEIRDYNDTLAKILGGSKIKLKFYRNGNLIAGDYITKESDGFKTLLDKAIESGHSVLLVTDNTTNGKYVSDKYKETDKFKRQSAEEAQGGEFDFVFVDKAVEPISENSDEYSKLKDLYTMTQRSRMGSIVLAPNDEYSSYVVSDADPSSMGRWEMSSEQRKEYEDWRLNPLNKLVPSDNYEENIRVGEKPEVPKENPDSNENAKGGEEKKPGVNPEGANAEQNEKPKPEAPAVEPETPPSPESTPPAAAPAVEETRPVQNDPAIPIAKPLEVPKINETETSEVVSEPLEDWKEDSSSEYADSENYWMKDVPSDAFDSTDFFNSIFTTEFFDSQKADEHSAYNFLKANNIKLSEEEYQQLILWFTRKALQNDFRFDDAGELNNAKGSLKKAIKLLSTSKAHSIQARIVTNGDKSEIRIVVVGNAKADSLFEVPVMSSSNILQEGIANIDGQQPFIIYGKPWYERDGVQKRDTVKGVLSRFRWLRRSRNAGVMAASEEFLKVETDPNKQTALDKAKINAVNFARHHKGVTYLTFYGIVTPRTDVLWQTETLPTGEKYLGFDRDITTKAGIQRLYENPDDLIKIAAAIDYLLNFNYYGSDLSTERFLGISGDNNTKIEAAARLLYNLTGNQAWIVDAITKPDKINSDYFGAVRSAIRSSAIISDDQNTRVFADLFGEILRNPERYKNEWFRLHGKFHNLNDRSFGLLLKFDPTHEYIIYTDSKQATPGRIYIYRTKYNGTSNKFDHNPIGNPIRVIETGGNPQTFAREMTDAINSLLSIFTGNLDINAFNSNRVRVSTAKIEFESGNVNKIYDEASINNWAVIFGDFSTLGSLSTLLNQDKFKHGLFAQFPIKQQYPNSQFGETEIRDDDTTMAVNWHAEMIRFSGKIVSSENENPSEAAATIGYALSVLNEVRKVGEKFVDESLLAELTEKYENVINNSVNLTDEQIIDLMNNLITEINNHILSNASSQAVSILNLAPDGNTIQIKPTDSRYYAYKNTITSNNATATDDDITNPIYQNRITGIDVISATDENGQVYFVFFNNEGKLTAVKTRTFAQWKALRDSLKELQERIDETRNLAYISNYVDKLLINTVDNVTITDYLKSIDALRSDVTYNRDIVILEDLIRDYLITRIENNEC